MFYHSPGDENRGFDEETAMFRLKQRPSGEPTGMITIGSLRGARHPRRLGLMLTLFLVALFFRPAAALSSPVAAQGTVQGTEGVILLPDPDTSKDMYRRLIELGTPESQCSNGASYVRNSFVTCLRQTAEDPGAPAPVTFFQCTFHFNLLTGEASSTDPCPGQSIIGVSN